MAVVGKLPALGGGLGPQLLELGLENLLHLGLQVGIDGEHHRFAGDGRLGFLFLQDVALGVLDQGAGAGGAPQAVLHGGLDAALADLVVKGVALFLEFLVFLGVNGADLADQMGGHVPLHVFAHRRGLHVHTGIFRVVFHDFIHGLPGDAGGENIGVLGGEVPDAHLIPHARDSPLLLGGVTGEVVGLHQGLHTVFRRGVVGHVQVFLQGGDAGIPLLLKGIGRLPGDGQGVVPGLLRLPQQGDEAQNDVVLQLLLPVVGAPGKIVVIEQHRVAGGIDRDGPQIPIQDFAPGGGDADFCLHFAGGQLVVGFSLHDLNLKKTQRVDAEDRHDQQGYKERTAFAHAVALVVRHHRGWLLSPAKGPASVPLAQGFGD